MSLENIREFKYLNEVENQARFHHLVHELTDHCWDICVEKPSSRLDSRSENCLSNCVERFIDTTNFIVNRFEKKAQFNSTSELEE